MGRKKLRYKGSGTMGMYEVKRFLKKVALWSFIAFFGFVGLEVYQSKKRYKSVAKAFLPAISKTFFKIPYVSEVAHKIMPQKRVKKKAYRGKRRKAVSRRGKGKKKRFNKSKRKSRSKKKGYRRRR